MTTLQLQEAMDAILKDPSIFTSTHQGLFANASLENWKVIIMPLVERMLKRNPATTVTALIPSIQAAPLTFSFLSFHSILLPYLLPELRHTEDSRRTNASLLVRQVLRHTSEIDGWISVTQSILDHLSGKKGAISQAAIRSVLMNAILSISLELLSLLGSTSISLENGRKFPNAILQPLSDIVEKDNAPEVRSIGVRSLANLMMLLPVPHECSLKHIINGINRAKDGNSIPAYLVALHTLLGIHLNHHVDHSFSKLELPSTSFRTTIESNVEKSVAILSTHIKNAISKPALHRKEGILSISLLILSNQLSTPALKKDISVVFKEPTSFINSPDIISASTLDDGEACTLLFRSLLSKDIYAFFKDENILNAAPFYQTVVRLSLHKATRRMFLDSFPRKLNGKLITAMLPELVNGFEQLIDRKNADTLASNVVWSQAFLRLFSSPMPTSLPKLILLSHFPLVCASTHHPSSTFRKMLYNWTQQTQKLRLPRVAAIVYQELMQSYSDQNEAIVKTLLGSEGILSSFADRRIAGSEAIVSLAIFAPELAANQTLSAVYELMNSSSLLSLSEYEIAVFHTPSGELCTAKKDNSPVVVQESKNVKRSKHSMYSKEDEEFEKKVASEIAKKKGKVDVEVQQKLKEQNEIREKISLARQQLCSVFHVFTTVAKHNKQNFGFASNFLLPAVLDPLYRLFDNSVVGIQSRLTHLSLLECLDPAVKGCGWTLAVAVQLCVRKQKKASDDPIHKEVIRLVLTLLAQRAAHKPFSAPAFHYISPLLSTVILNSKDMSLEELNALNAAKGEPEALVIRTTTKRNTVVEEDDFDEEDGEDEKESSTRDPAGHQPAVSSAVRVVRIHCKLPPPSKLVHVKFPVREMIYELLHAYAFMNDLKDQAAEALRRLAPSLHLLDLDPLLGDAGLLFESETIRSLCLETLELVPSIRSLAVPSTNNANFEKAFKLLLYRLYLSCHDTDGEVSRSARTLWQELKLEIDDQYLTHLLRLLEHNLSHVRIATSNSIGGAVRQFPATVLATIDSLIQLYSAYPDKVVNARSGVRGSGEIISNWRPRQGAILAIHACFDSIDSESVFIKIFNFFLSSALRDDHETVWNDVLKCGLKLINSHGSKYITTILPVLEKYMKIVDAPNAEEIEAIRNDHVREASIIFIGTIARFMPENSQNLINVLESLIEVLKTPSHSVQKAVAECLPPLVSKSAIQKNVGKYVNLLMTRLSKGEDYGERKGASFGLASIIKGLKYSSLKEYNIVNTLTTLVQDQRSSKARQGALFAYERLFFDLGVKFEPYVVQILPFLLTSAGDSNQEVRDASSDAARMMMSHLTGHGVKIVLPLVLTALQDSDKSEKKADKKSTAAPSWRMKTESIDLLGAMAYCAPQQLSTALPRIVPRLLEVMTDPNTKVQIAGRLALKQIAAVVRNPEILQLTPVLLAALNDPSMNTKRALNELMKTTFVHSVDPPSLALVIPILHKGLRGRTPPVKKMAAQVVGSISALLTEIKDILPYAPNLLKDLKLILVDPHPEVRHVAARAIGTLYRGIGPYTEGFDNLIIYLMDVLRGETSSVQRSGSAQGLAQVLYVEGVDKLQEIMPELLAYTRADKAVVRESFLELISYLPSAFGNSFASFIPNVFPVIVKSFSDDINHVREAALMAGQSFVVAYASSHTELLLPALDTGIADKDWRVRLSSVQLLGLLLLRLAGLSGKLLLGPSTAMAEEDDLKDSNVVTTREQEMQVESLVGTDRRNRLFAKIYLLRSDVITSVKEMSWRVWKGLVFNTPRMLNIILHILMQNVIDDLASSDDARQIAAGSALGELVQKMGNSILSQIIPILQRLLNVDDAQTRQGVCLGYSEILRSARKSDLAAYMPEIIPSIRDALCDEEEIVHAAAGKAFQTLYRQLNKRAIDEIVPSLVASVDAAGDDLDESKRILDGIREILYTVNQEVLPYLIPTLAAAPITVPHIRALAALADLFDRGFHRYIPTVFNGIVDAMTGSANVKDDAERIILCIPAESVHTLFDTLITLSQETKQSSTKIACLELLGIYCGRTEVDIDSNLPMVLQLFIHHLNDPDAEVQSAAWDSLDATLKVKTDEVLAKHIPFVRQVIQDTIIVPMSSQKLSLLPGLNLKRGPAPLLPMFQYGLLQGAPAMRVEAINGLSEIISLTTEKALSPYVIKITGPLIRIVGDRFPGEVKAAILRTLDLLIVKTGKFLRPFLPQLQTTFLKSLSDVSETVRSTAGTGLVNLLLESKRADPVVIELLNSFNGVDTTAEVQASILIVLATLLAQAELASKLSAENLKRLLSGFQSTAANEHQLVRKANAQCLAKLCQYLSNEEVHSLVDQVLVTPKSASWAVVDSYIFFFGYLERFVSKRFETNLDRQQIVDWLITQLQSHSHLSVKSDALLTLLEFAKLTNTEDLRIKIMNAYAPFINDETALIRSEVCRCIQSYAEVVAEPNFDIFDIVMPSLLARSTDTNGPARRASQMALYCLLQFHVDVIKAEKILNQYGIRIQKKPSTSTMNWSATLTALLTYAKRTLQRLKYLPVRDELNLVQADAEEYVPDFIDE